ncbi:MAG: hypothetical protein AAGL96_14580 [Pseudomonadota bacterium]
MSTALTTLTTHYDRLRNQKFTVPGVTTSEGEPLVIYFDPPTQAESIKVRNQAGTTDDAKVALWTVIYLAKDKDGNRLFDESAATIQALTEQVPSQIIGQIANAILRFTPVADLGN